MFKILKDKEDITKDEEKRIAEELDEAIKRNMKEEADNSCKPDKEAAAEYDQMDDSAERLKGLTLTLAYGMAEKAAKNFVEITKVAGIKNMGRVLSLMEECEPYVNVLILESVFATCGALSGVEDMELLYFCVENAPNLFVNFKEDFMTMDEIEGIIKELITSAEDLVE